MRRARAAWSETEIAVVRSLFELHSDAFIAGVLADQCGVDRTLHQVRTLRRVLGMRRAGIGDGRFRPGNTSHNKGCKGWSAPGTEATRFQRGNRPSNSTPVGTHRQTTARTRYDRRNRRDYKVPPYWRVKVAEPNTWVFLHTFLWEAVNGPVPPDHVLIYIDGDTENCVIENLELVTRGELAGLNRHADFADAPLELRRTIIAMIRVRCAIGNRTTGVVTAPNGQKKHLREHAKDYGLQHATVYARIRNGYTVAEALTLPLGGKRAL